MKNQESYLDLSQLAEVKRLKEILIERDYKEENNIDEVSSFRLTKGTIIVEFEYSDNEIRLWTFSSGRTDEERNKDYDELVYICEVLDYIAIKYNYTLGDDESYYFKNV